MEKVAGYLAEITTTTCLLTVQVAALHLKMDCHVVPDGDEVDYIGTALRRLHQWDKLAEEDSPDFDEEVDDDFEEIEVEEETNRGDSDNVSSAIIPSGAPLTKYRTSITT